VGEGCHCGNADRSCEGGRKMIHLVLGLVALFLAFRVYKVVTATVMALGDFGASAPSRKQPKKPSVVPKGVN